MLGRSTSDAVFGSNQVTAVRVPVIPHVRQRGTRSRKGERESTFTTCSVVIRSHLTPHPDATGERRLEPFHVPDRDQVSCSFDGMCVKVTGSTTCWFISIQNFDANLSCFSMSPHYVTCSGGAKCEAFVWHGCESPGQLRSKLDHRLTTCCSTLFTV